MIFQAHENLSRPTAFDLEPKNVFRASCLSFPETDECELHKSLPRAHQESFVSHVKLKEWIKRGTGVCPVGPWDQAGLPCCPAWSGERTEA